MVCLDYVRNKFTVTSLFSELLRRFFYYVTTTLPMLLLQQRIFNGVESNVVFWYVQVTHKSFIAS